MTVTEVVALVSKHLELNATFDASLADLPLQRSGNVGSIILLRNIRTFSKTSFVLINILHYI